jgi:hypothetical protein
MNTFGGWYASSCVVISDSLVRPADTEGIVRRSPREPRPAVPIKRNRP